MKYIFLLTGLLIATAVSSQTMDCKKFRNGKFRIIDASAGNTTLIRKGNRQTEIVDMTGKKYTFKVTWISDCTYALSPLKAHKQKNNSDPDDTVVTVVIVETKENSYMIEASSGANTKVYRNEVIRID